MARTLHGSDAEADGLEIRGIASKRTPEYTEEARAAKRPVVREETPFHDRHTTVSRAFLPRGTDANLMSRVGKERRDGADPALTAKLATFHTLKQQGTHFNATLAKNRAFHNPHIYEKLVKWAELDEHGSNYVAIAKARGDAPPWDPKDVAVLAQGNIERLGTS
ncbi:hypothetical protein MVES1_000991 [Malassezia vespertilionis]|uniref:Uncharacterized protein n=1 Tax=Malassezia vespertilionis TaxID=2020962 RepID=A0A2N1JE00_9BASI|nr:uncharacterized protein MVES1_000991 [Malassezia vespertilionis]PKI84764.1 hypothetical protein MVES_000928 [Malassezia vespertilionis]WFD05659.1 hypothetical protein MVES1_000991 [Malassezia vespertilionis]